MPIWPDLSYHVGLPVLRCVLGLCGEIKNNIIRLKPLGIESQYALSSSSPVPSLLIITAMVLKLAPPWDQMFFLGF